jgi:putative ABC transport system permease protein
MFFVTYLRRELSRRMRQAVFIVLGLALGVGLVVTVSAASAGVKKAQSSVLSALYGVGTDVTVTGAAPKPPTISPGQAPPKGAQQILMGPNGPESCTSSGKCTSMAGKTQDNVSSNYAGISTSKVAEAARLRDVKAAVGGITLSNTSITFSKSDPDALPQPVSYTVDGVDIGNVSLGPLSSASLASGHSFTAAQSDSYVAVVDSGYATAHNLKVGSTISIDQANYTVIGIVSQPQGSNPPDVYVPLARAQAMSVLPSTLKDEVNTIYLTAASGSDISTVSKEVSTLLPGTTVTTASSLASEATGSVNSAASLANNLGRWLSVLVLIAAFAVASLLTIAAVARRAREFGTLKAIGWRSRRIVGQVLGESAALGIAGAAAGVGLGFAGAAIIAAIAPKLSETTGGSGTAGGTQVGSAASGAPANGQPVQIGGNPPHTVGVVLHPAVSPGVIVLAVILAVAGGLLAGVIGSWRISQLRPADALARVA